MSDPFLEFSLQNFTAEQLAVKVKNISSAVLDKTLIIELQPPLYLLSKRINEAAVNAPNREKPIGSETLAGIVSAADGWSTWVRRETSDSSAFIVLTNDLNHE